MRPRFAMAVVLVLLPTQELAGQVCAGSTAGNGQLGLSGLWGRSGSADAYGLDAQVNLPGRASAGLRYTYSGETDTYRFTSGDVPVTRRWDRSLHALNGRVAYELSEGRLSICPALGANYTDGVIASSPLDSNSQDPATYESSWRTVAVPATLDVGLRIRAPGGVVLIPSASAGGMLWHFQGRAAYHLIDGRVQEKGSQLAAVGSLGLTLGWNRFFLTGGVYESSLPLSRREWSLSVGSLFR
jgi:hypothetical protein